MEQPNATAYYRAQAEAMLRLSERTIISDVRQTYLDLARNWLALADFHEAKHIRTG
jgi:hypothetical protein